MQSIGGVVVWVDPGPVQSPESEDYWAQEQTDLNNLASAPPVSFAGLILPGSCQWF